MLPGAEHTKPGIQLIQWMYCIKKTFTDVAIIDAGVLKEKLAKLKSLPPSVKEIKLSEETVNRIEKFKQWLRSRRYSDSTIGTYTDALKSFLKFYKDKPLIEITNDDVIKYNNEYILENKLSASYQNQVVNAIKLFFKTIQNKSIDVDIIHRPKRPKLLPNVLSKEEVKLILEAPRFLKHKAMLSLMYSCGLRCGEILRLKTEHIDAKRNIIIIKQSKGRKNRIAPLSDKTIQLLRVYFTAFKPTVYLFEGEKAGNLTAPIQKAGFRVPKTVLWLMKH